MNKNNTKKTKKKKRIHNSDINGIKQKIKINIYICNIKMVKTCLSDEIHMLLNGDR